MVVANSELTTVTTSPAPVMRGVSEAGMSAEKIMPLVMWRRRMDWRTVVLSSSSWNIPSGRDSKAASSGAKTVMLELVRILSSPEDLRAVVSLVRRVD